MLVTAAERDAIRDAWKVGEPYQDVTLASLRVRRPASDVVPLDEVVTLTPVPPTWRLTSDGMTTDAPCRQPAGVRRGRWPPHLLVSAQPRSPSASGRSWPAPWAGSRPSARAR